MLGLLFLVLSFCWVTYRIYKKKGFSSSCFLFTLYTISSLAALFLVLIGFAGANPKINNYDSGYLFLTVALLLFLYPFYDLDDNNIKSVNVPDRRILDIFMIITTSLSLFSIVYFVPIAAEMMFVDVEDVYELRIAVARGDNPFITPSIFNTIAGTSASFYSVQLLLFFLYVIREERRSYIKWYNWIILFSSFSYPVFVLAYLGRDGVVFWLMSFLSMLLLFRKFIHNELLKKIKKTVVYILLPFGAVFVFITLGRFVVKNDDGSFLLSTINYMGQGPINFAEIFDTDIKTLGHGRGLFPLIFGESSDNLKYLLNHYGLVPWVFKTFVYSVYNDFDVFGTLLIAFSLCVVYKFTFVRERINRDFPFQYLLLYVFFFTIYSQGLFYLRHGYRVGNLYIFTILLLALFFTFIRQERIYVYGYKDNQPQCEHSDAEKVTS